MHLVHGVDPRARVVDVRSSAAFDGGHIADSVNLPMDAASTGAPETWAADLSALGIGTGIELDHGSQAP